MLVNPASPTSGILFQFEDIWTPEGYYRIKLWRGGGLAFRENGQTFITRSTILNTILLRSRLITTLPIDEESAENFFSEITFNSFQLGIYNTNSTSDIISITMGTVIHPNASLVFGDGADGRLIFQYIVPSGKLFGSWSFLPHGSSVWTEPRIGLCQEAVEGSDKRWYHATQDNPILDERLNAPLDAEEMYTLKFSHVVHSAIAQAPVVPSVDPTDTSSWYMPFFDPTSIHSAVPFESLMPGIKNAIYDTTVVGIQNPRWMRYIDVNYYLRLLLNYVFGVGNYTIRADLAPIRISGMQLADYDTTQSTANLEENGLIFPPHFIDFSSINNFFLPQCLWGLYDPVPKNAAVPLFESKWPSYHQNAWDSIVELSMSVGYIPILKSINGKADLYFKDRTQPLDVEFSGPVPSNASPTANDDSENGIQIEATKSFLNAIDVNGYYDDIFAFKKGNPNPYDIIENPQNPNRNVSPRQRNGYTVPATATKPASLKIGLRCGGFQYVINHWSIFGPIYSGIPAVGFYSSYNGPGDTSDTMNWPNLAPLVPGTGSITVDATHNRDLIGHFPLIDFSPAARIHFLYKDTNNNLILQANDSFRQGLARFYAIQFVASNKKYVVEDKTINQFYKINTIAPVNSGDPKIGDRIGGPSLENLQLFHQRMFPDLNRYYCKHITRDPNTMSTHTEYILVKPNPYLNGVYYDTTENTGTNFNSNDRGDRGGGGPTGG